MLLYAIIALAVAAVGGLIMATKVLAGQPAPWLLSIVHALLGATGLVLIIVATMQSGWPGQLGLALGILVVAALGGFYLASQHLSNKIPPKAVVLIHAAAAVVGFVLLIAAFMG